MIDITEYLKNHDFTADMVDVNVWRPEGIEVFLDLEPKKDEKGVFVGPYFELNKIESRKLNKKIMTHLEGFVVDEVLKVKPKYVQEIKVCKPTGKS
jgi:hypothetical protein